jgi:dienelactone hydrolase
MVRASVRRVFSWCLVVGVLSVHANSASSQHTPPASELRSLQAASDALTRRIGDLRQPAESETREQRQAWADAAVFAKAAEWMLRHDEFFKPDYQRQLQRVLERGEDRAAQVESAVSLPGGNLKCHVYGYVSKIDHSVQPYAVTLPQRWADGVSGSLPLHVVLHGRANQMNEVNFISRFQGIPTPEDQSWIQLDVYGRGNNAYRWAGETDVFEALQDVKRRFSIDENRITLRGFSMGGAGAWHLGLHYPDLWNSVGPGAGFVDFYKYQNQKKQLPPWQHATLGIYDAVDYAMNAANVPVCSYGGENDAQLVASTTMASSAAAIGVDLNVIVGPGMGHRFDASSRREFMKFHLQHTQQGRPAYLKRKSIRFTTRTLKYNKCDWLTIEEMARQYVPATIEATINEDGDVDVVTDNVTAFRIFRDVGSDVIIDGVRLRCRSAADGLLPDVYFQKTGDGWEVLNYDRSRAFANNPDLSKRHNLQGPIDDAFMQPFVCVVGTGTPWNQAAHAWAMNELERFQKTHDKWMRGVVRVVRDVDLTDDHVRDNNIVLFGDPGTNSILAKFLPELPIIWTRDSLQVAGREWDPGRHIVNIIYPNPWNPRRYVVVNSGFTVRDVDFEASNSWLFPKLGDISVRKMSFDRVDARVEDTSDVAWAANFDSHWRLEHSGQHR